MLGYSGIHFSNFALVSVRIYRLTLPHAFTILLYYYINKNNSYSDPLCLPFIVNALYVPIPIVMIIMITMIQ